MSGWLQADLLEGVPDGFDAVLANLPYVAERERATLAPEILRHEPHGALFAGDDGLDAIRALLAQLAAAPERELRGAGGRRRAGAGGRRHASRGRVCKG